MNSDMFRIIDDLSSDNANLKTMVLRQFDEIRALKSRVDSIEKKLSEIHEWEELIYSEIMPIYDWFCTRDLRNLRPEDIVSAVIDTIELERKSDLERKQERNKDAVKNQAGTVGNISGRYRKGEDIQRFAGEWIRSGEMVEEVCQNSTSGCGANALSCSSLGGI